MLRDYANGRWEKWQKVATPHSYNVISMSCILPSSPFSFSSIDPNRSEREIVSRGREEKEVSSGSVVVVVAGAEMSRRNEQSNWRNHRTTSGDRLAEEDVDSQSLSLWLIINTTTTPNRIDWERERQGSKKEPGLLPFLPPNLIVPTTACGKLPCADADFT